MKPKAKKKIVLKCSQCGNDNTFNQPYQYHAGFGNQGFLYNEAGDRTLIWGSFDPDYQKIVGKKHPWALSDEDKKLLEQSLLADEGGRWLFANPARCLKCKAPISGPIDSTIYYIRYENSIDLDPISGKDHGLRDIIKK